MKDSQFNKIQGWFGTLNNNMERMQGDIERMQSDIDHMKGDIDHMKEDMNFMKNDIDFVKGDMNQLRQDMQTGFDAVHSDMAILKSSARRIDSRMAFIERNTIDLHESDHDQQNALRDFHVRLERVEEHIST